MSVRSEVGDEAHDFTLENGALGGYVLTGLRGSGGMGTVYEARHPTLGKRVALKVIKGSLVDYPVARERFLREARAIALISHPHVVDVFDLGVDGERAFIVMELLEGETLEARLARKGRFDLSHAVDLMLPVISAAAAIHESGVVHRDLKPGNVMLARRGRVAVEPVVLDFGISVGPDTPGAEDGLTGPHLLVGTLSYLAPELMRDARAAGPRSDQYAVGVMLYECVTGRKPFTGADRYELIHAAMTSKVTAPGEIAPDIPKGFEQIVLRALDRRPESRFPSMRAFGAALLSFADRSGWKRWAGEFAGADPAAGNVSTNETVPDVRSAVAIAARTGTHRRRSLGLAAGACSLAALAAAIAVSRPSVPAPSPPPPATQSAPPATIEQPPIPPPPPAPQTATGPEPAAAPPATSEPTGRRAGARALRRRQAAATPAVDATPASPDGAPNSGKSMEEAQADDAIDPFAPVR
jgi:tRNA A-37 threonylcarbamoyl transferase component Bud32